jgi:hypothetical protein
LCTKYIIVIFLIIIIACRLILIKKKADTSGVKWQKTGKWAFGCDFKNDDLKNVQIAGEKCSSLCASTSGCTHFTWTTYKSGTCWMKSGSVTKSDAIQTNDNTMVCGII